MSDRPETTDDIIREMRDPDITAKGCVLDVAWELELLAALDERMRKEAKKCK